MNAPTGHDVMTLLAEMDAAAKAAIVDLNDTQTLQEDLVYVAFLVCGQRVLSLLKDLREIIYVPDRITRVPGVQPWMRGVANVRGSLMPIVDLQFFLCGTEQVDTPHTRVLVTERGGIPVGLQVPAVYGLRHISSDVSPQRELFVAGSLRDFITGGYLIDDETWPVFSADALAQHPKFRVASL